MYRNGFEFTRRSVRSFELIRLMDRIKCESLPRRRDRVVGVDRAQIHWKKITVME